LELVSDLESQSIKKFFNYSYIESTDQYHYFLTRFLNWSDFKNFDDFLSSDKVSQVKLIQSFLDELAIVNRNSVLEAYFKAFRLFYLANNYDLDEDDFTYPDDDRILGIPYTTQEILKILDIIDNQKNNSKEKPRNKALILLLATSSLRIQDLTHLQIHDLTPIQNSYAIEYHGGHYKTQEQIDTMLKVNRHIYNPWFTTFTTPQTREALDIYLESRNDLQSDDFVFDTTYNAMKLFLSRMLKQIGFKRILKGGTYSVRQDQGFRKRYFNILESNGLDRKIIEIMKIENLWKGKVKLTDQELEKYFVEFKKIIPYLTLETGLNSSISE